jgi:NTE family protein
MLSLKNFVNKNIKSGIFNLTSAEKFLAKNLPINNFDELKIPTYVSATNLEKNEGVLIGPGSNITISKALMASCCLPLLFRPVKINDNLYIDGEIKRPLSVNEAMDLGAEIVIVSDVYSPYIDGTSKTNMWKIGSQVINMLLGDKSYRGIKICEARYPDREIILVSPMVGDISIFNSFAFNTLFDRGFNEAIKKLGENNGNRFG